MTNTPALFSQYLDLKRQVRAIIQASWNCTKIERKFKSAEFDEQEMKELIPLYQEVVKMVKKELSNE